MKLLLALLLAPLLLAGDDEDSKKNATPRANGEVTLRVVEASSAPNAANDAADLVPAELKTLLRFTRYRLLDSAYLRGLEGRGMTVTLAGNLESKVEFTVKSRQPVLLLEYVVEVMGPPPDSGKRNTTLLETKTTAKAGETVVLGASRMRDSSNALIVLLTGKLLP
jgi:hypothetical protein